MNTKGEFDIQQFLTLEPGQEDHQKRSNFVPYPDTTDFDAGTAVSMPEVGDLPPQQFLSERYPLQYHENYDHSPEPPQIGELNTSIPSITVQADERPSQEIYSPLYHTADSPYDASPYDHASPLSVPFPSVASPAGSPGNTHDWDEYSVGGDDVHGLSFRSRGSSFPGMSSMTAGSWDDDAKSIDQIIEDFFDPQDQNLPLQPGREPNHDGPEMRMPHQAASQLPINTQQHSLQVPGNDYYYGSSGSESQYLSAPSSPSLAPSSPRSGRSSPIPHRRARAYSSPYELSGTDGDESPNTMGVLSGANNKRGAAKKNPSLYPCDQCDKKFTRAYNLRSHMRTHTHERPFACSVCGKAFARQHDRKRHEDLHTGEKRFVCSGFLADKAAWGCGRRFARADALGRHFRTEAGKACISTLRDDIASKIGQTENVSEGIVLQGFVNNEAKLIAIETDDDNQTRRAVILSALAEQIMPPEI